MHVNTFKLKIRMLVFLFCVILMLTNNCKELLREKKVGGLINYPNAHNGSNKRGKGRGGIIT